MRILSILDKVYASSLARFHSSYAEGFPQREHFLFSELKKQRVKFDFFYHDDLRHPENLKREYREVGDLLGKQNYDFIFVNNPFSGLLLRGRDLKGCLVFDCIDRYGEMYEQEFPTDFGGRQLLTDGLNFLMRESKKIIFQGPQMGELLPNKTHPNLQIAVIPNGYRKDLFYEFDTQKFLLWSTSWRKLHSALDKKILVFVGKLGHWYSGVLELCSVICKMNDWVFVVVGDGPLAGEVKKYNPDKVIFTGRKDLKMIPAYMNLADVGCLPVSDDSPLATSEFVACGKPMLHYGDRISWLIQDGVNGKLNISGTSHVWLKDSLEWCYENQDKAQRWNRWAKRGLAWNELAARFKAFLLQS